MRTVTRAPSRTPPVAATTSTRSQGGHKRASAPRRSCQANTSAAGRAIRVVRGLAGFLDEVREGLLLRQTLTFGLLAALLVLLAWLAFAVYRGMIAPLRARLRNAADSIGSNGRVVLRTRETRASLRGASRRVAVLEVEDNGRGIPPEAQARLFDPFFTTKPNGTGLGLSIAVRIVEKHGGALRYQTQMNRGTTFGIVLPLGTAPGTAGAQKIEQ